MSNEFFNELTAVFEVIVPYSCPVVITGDLNIHLDINSDSNAAQLIELLGFVQSVVGPTHSHGRTLDVVITRSDLPAPLIHVGLPDEVSDHSLLLYQIQADRPRLTVADVSTRAWKGFDEDSFRYDLQNSQLCASPETFLALTADELQNIYDSTLAELVDKHAPRCTVRRRIQLTTPWFDGECAQAKRRVRFY